MLHAVLFDLDDTLFDHERSAREALAAVHGSYEPFKSVTFAAFEDAHATILEELHVRVLAGEIDIDAARIQRFRRLFQSVGVLDSPAADAAMLYRQSYVRGRRAVAGAQPLLAALRGNVKIGIVSNNLLAEQEEKMRHCGIDRLVDVLVVSESAGVAKPDPAIFRIALERLGAAPHETVMVGDSWFADVQGAGAAGIPAVWFNRAGRPCPDPTAGVVELRSLEPAQDAIDLIRLAHSNYRADRD